MSIFPAVQAPQTDAGHRAARAPVQWIGRVSDCSPGLVPWAWASPLPPPSSLSEQVNRARLTKGFELSSATLWNARSNNPIQFGVIRLTRRSRALAYSRRPSRGGSHAAEPKHASRHHSSAHAHLASPFARHRWLQHSSHQRDGGHARQDGLQWCCPRRFAFAEPIVRDHRNRGTASP